MNNANKEDLVIESQYLPCFLYFKNLSKCKHVKIEQYEHYKKMSFRNRCFLSGPNGLLSLSVPLQNGRGQKALIRDVKICYKENWPVRHWRSVHDAYRKSPFFDFYMDDIKSFFDKPPAFLFDWNLQWTNWLCKQMAIESAIELTEKYVMGYPKGYKDLRDFISPKNYIELGKDLPAYPQVFEERNGFHPNLSVLDALFCNGPSVKHLLDK